MAKIHRLTSEHPAKFGFKKARRRSSRLRDDPEQLDLFNAASAGRIVVLPTRLSPFEEALLLDERGSAAATSAYERAISEGDSVADAYCNLGIIHYHEGAVEQAVNSFTSALAEAPRHFESHFNLANLFFDRGEFEAAAHQYAVAARIHGDYPNLFFNQGLVLALLERYEPAFEALTTFRALAADEEGRIADDLLESLRDALRLTS